MSAGDIGKVRQGFLRGEAAETVFCVCALLETFFWRSLFRGYDRGDDTKALAFFEIVCEIQQGRSLSVLLLDVLSSSTRRQRPDMAEKLRPPEDRTAGPAGGSFAQQINVSKQDSAMRLGRSSAADESRATCIYRAWQKSAWGSRWLAGAFDRPWPLRL